jgi:glycosyltransferase involved in cell wall biosynthesis
MFPTSDRKLLKVPLLNIGWKPRVSIFCPTYNHEETIGKTLSSFFDQDFGQPFEIIVSDDASTDATLDVLVDWKRQFPEYIKIIKFTKNILQNGRNPFECFFKFAQGEFFAGCEGDDFWLDRAKLRLQVEMLEEHPEMVSCTHAFMVYEALTRETYLLDNEGSLRAEAPSHIQAAKRIFMFPTLVYRNNISRQRMPGEWFTCKNGDQIMTSFLGNFGGNIHMPGLVGSVYNKNPFSIWNPLNSSEKNIERYRTAYALFKMNSRMRNKKVTDFRRNQLDLFKLPNECKLKIMSEVDEKFKLTQNFKFKDLNFEIL